MKTLETKCAQGFFPPLHRSLLVHKKSLESLDVCSDVLHVVPPPIVAPAMPDPHGQVVHPLTIVSPVQKKSRFPSSPFISPTFILELQFFPRSMFDQLLESVLAHLMTTSGSHRTAFRECLMFDPLRLLISTSPQSLPVLSMT